MEHKIDFVITWVDNSDPAWRESCQKHAKAQGRHIAVCSERYRDWDNLRYWFRGIEAFAPWVNKIHFVTCGHLPSWLNTQAPKLHIVKHSDYMDERYLPTFSSHPIEFCMHKIEGLSDHFVYFNDDTFIIDNFTGFYDHHLPQSFLKSTFIDAWKHNENLFDETCTHSFRDKEDVCIWVMRYWQLVNGNFHPYNVCNDSKYFLLDNINKVEGVAQFVASQKKNLVVINDSPLLENFERAKKEINGAFDRILPNKCSFEK